MMALGRAGRVANFSIAAVFALGAVVQFNDPDPARWVVMYAAAATTCVLAGFGRAPWWLAAAVGLAALSWAALVGLSLAGSSLSITELFAAQAMQDPRAEKGRELGGLLLIVAWMMPLAVRLLQRRRAE